ncbi:MAG TPA: DUF134 domain-containing protein [Candidatus Desulfovibrio intestinipullorum]|uniref:UPF0251 protein H9894_10720 n=1 Tax=Candidatus Desulfovibrio intestinipullorum TaxID=2838536 RepID=A0A9D1TQD8_9BACT|nr:DUF134 domain-containing protein [Candidatus Desulfovibrio intestinipullorum]
MARPKHCRYVERAPNACYFKPCGIPFYQLDEVRLSVEGLEALRLSDIEGLTASEAALRVRVSRHSYGRTLAEARKAVAEALVHGKVLRIEGGSYVLLQNGHSCFRKRRPDTMITVAISSEGPTLEDMVDSRYGRAGGFLLASFADNDLNRDPEIAYLDNGDAQIMAQGAGIATTEHLCNAGVTVVLSGYVGPKAFEALEAAGIDVYQDMDNMTVGQALDKFRKGECTKASAANHESGMPL